MSCLIFDLLTIVRFVLLVIILVDSSSLGLRVGFGCGRVPGFLGRTLF